MEMHFATIWESIADVIGDADAVIQGGRRITWHDFDDEAARFAGFLRANGIGGENSTPFAGQAKLGLYLYNCPEYLIAQYGAFKERLVPLNVNYRYLDNELLYLLDNGDVEVLVYHASLADRVARVKDKAPNVKLWIEVDDEGDRHRSPARSHGARPRPARPPAGSLAPKTISTCSTPVARPVCLRA